MRFISDILAIICLLPVMVIGIIAYGVFAAYSIIKFDFLKK